MPALNFMKQFINAVLNGNKRQTIRKVRRRGQIKVGDTLMLYTGMRTKHCHKLAVARCGSVTPILIGMGPEYVVRAGTTLLTLRAKQTLAKADGFENFAEMLIWFYDKHGLPFEGVLIKW